MVHSRKKSEHQHPDRHDPTEDNSYPQIFWGENIYFQVRIQATPGFEPATSRL